MRTILFLVNLFIFISASGHNAFCSDDNDGFLGLVLAQIPQENAQKMGFDHSVVGVMGLASGASAQKAGVKEGDIVLKFKGEDIKTVKELMAASRATTPGSTETLLVLRNKKEIPFKIKIVSRKEFLGTEVNALKGKKAPEFNGTNVKTGKKMSISKLIGKPIIIELWATWCPACLKNMSRLDAVAKKYKDKISVVAITFEQFESVKKFSEGHDVSYDLVVADISNINLSYMNNVSIPKYLIVDSKGIVVAVVQGMDEVEGEVEKVVGNRSNSR